MEHAGMLGKITNNYLTKETGVDSPPPPRKKKQTSLLTRQVQEGAVEGYVPILLMVQKSR